MLVCILMVLLKLHKKLIFSLPRIDNLTCAFFFNRVSFIIQYHLVFTYPYKKMAQMRAMLKVGKEEVTTCSLRPLNNFSEEINAQLDTNSIILFVQTVEIITFPKNSYSFALQIK